MQDGFGNSEENFRETLNKEAVAEKTLNPVIIIIIIIIIIDTHHNSCSSRDNCYDRYIVSR